MPGIKFIDSDLSESVFSRAYIAGGYFLRNNMPKVDAGGAFMLFCEFHKCMAMNSSYNDVKLNGSFFDKTDFSGSDFRDSDFTAIDYSDEHFYSYRDMGVKMDNDKIETVRKTGVKIISTVFSKCDFSRVKINKINKKILENEILKNRDLINWKD